MAKTLEELSDHILEYLKISNDREDENTLYVENFVIVSHVGDINDPNVSIMSTLSGPQMLSPAYQALGLLEIGRQHVSVH